MQISDGNGTHYEQTAACAAVSMRDLKMIREEDNLDLGHGIHGIGGGPGAGFATMIRFEYRPSVLDYKKRTLVLHRCAAPRTTRS